MEKLGTDMRLLLDPDKLETNFNMTLKRFPLKEYNCSVTFLFSYFLNHSVVQKNLRICGKTWQNMKLFLNNVGERVK